ncbi:uncharacterized protein LOC116845791 isoform X2 [Odontomachus brunneus]|uniref:uncharacterized protein LOC116845791 isoform X2 n=1 Tax=Odontomachus brunneus TaxID=486640 RepID=UPI0013F1C9F5|nr:uncharacterized protein LOC116845791 isoform X2 [Odontomachus brunneus]
MIEMEKDLKSEGLRDGTTMSKRILKTTMNAIAHNNSNVFRTASTEPPVPPPSNNSNYDTGADKWLGLFSICFVVMSIIFTIFCCYVYKYVCGCGKRKTSEPSTPQRTSEPNNNMMETVILEPTCSEISYSRPSPHLCFMEPPPTYESIFDLQTVLSPLDKKDRSDNFNIIAPRTGSYSDELEANWINKREYILRDDQELPSYEAALKLDSNGYV